MPRAQFIDVHFEGFPELTSTVRSLAPTIQGKVVRPAMRAGAKVVMLRARGLAPRNTGRLAGGDWTVRASRRRGFVGSVVLSPTRRSLGIRPGRTGYYPYSNNYGWLSGRAAILGPHSLKRVLTKATRDAIEAQHARATGRRRIPGTRFLNQALFGYLPMVFDAAVREAQARLALVLFKPGSTEVLIDVEAAA